MIKLILEVEEKGTKKFPGVKAGLVDVNIEEINYNGTKTEKEIVKIFKEKIGTNDKFQVLNKCENRNIDELLYELFK